MNTPNKRGFTLVELVIVIVILGILATIALPRFMNLASKAQEATEDAAIGALRSAISIDANHNFITGTKNIYGYYTTADNPFNLLAQAPSNKTYDSPTPDNLTWQTFQDPTTHAWFIMCPHYAGTQYGAGTKGRYYIYQVSGGSWGHRAGDLWLYHDYGH